MGNRCPHHNVQQFTECCADCGRNIYETDEQYLQYLLGRKADQNRSNQSLRIEQLEKELGISHPGNSQVDAGNDQTSSIGW